MNSRHAPLPDFSKRLTRRRELIAERLGLADAQEIGAAIEELASYLAHAWTFVRDVDRNLSIAKQRNELRRLLQGSTIDFAAVQHLDPAVANRIGKYLPGGTQQLLYGQPCWMASIECAALLIRYRRSPVVQFQTQSSS